MKNSSQSFTMPNRKLQQIKKTWCQQCNLRITSECPHIPMTARERKRLAKKEGRKNA